MSFTVNIPGAAAPTPYSPDARKALAPSNDANASGVVTHSASATGTPDDVQTPPSSAGESGSNTADGSSRRDLLKQIRQQISEANQHLRELQQRLQQAQAGQASSSTDNSEVAALQAQIASASSNLLALQASLTTLEHGVDTTA